MVCKTESLILIIACKIIDSECFNCIRMNRNVKIISYYGPRGPGVHNMLRVRVCVAHMGRF